MTDAGGLSGGPSGSAPRTFWGALADDLVSLAEMPDDRDEAVDGLLTRIAVAAVDVIAGVDYASITAWRGAGYTTVAASSDLARAVDEAQYADGAGPCVEAERTAAPVGVPDIGATTMSWPRFHERATALGLRTSASVPLFAGRGTPVAVLNMYGREPAALDRLRAGIQQVFATERVPAQNSTLDADSGTRQLLNGLGLALRIRVTIQRAVGMLMTAIGSDEARAHRMIRGRATTAAESLSTTALRVIAELEPRPSPDVRVTVLSLAPDELSVTVSGELAAPVDPAVAGRLAAVLDEPARVLRWDLSGLRFCDVAGLRLLLDLRRRAADDGRRMYVVAASPAVHILLRLTGTGTLFGYPPASESTAAAGPAD